MWAAQLPSSKFKARSQKCNDACTHAIARPRARHGHTNPQHKTPNVPLLDAFRVPLFPGAPAPPLRFALPVPAPRPGFCGGPKSPAGKRAKGGAAEAGWGESGGGTEGDELPTSEGAGAPARATRRAAAAGAPHTRPSPWDARTRTPTRRSWPRPPRTRTAPREASTGRATRRPPWPPLPRPPGAGAPPPRRATASCGPRSSRSRSRCPRYWARDAGLSSWQACWA